jgi:hypothetical protein
MRFVNDPLMRCPAPPPLGPLFAIPLARSSDPPTSRRAADSLDPRSLLHRLARVYEAAGAAGLTDEEAAAQAGIPTAWKRCSDLRRLGYIKTNGATRVGSSGRDQMVCVWMEVAA